MIELEEALRGATTNMVDPKDSGSTWKNIQSLPDRTGKKEKEVELPGLLRLPVEIRLKIYQYLFWPRANRFCPHNRLPLMVFGGVRLRDYDLYKGMRKHKCEPWCKPRHDREQLEAKERNRVLYPVGWGNDATIARVNRQIYREMTDVMYSDPVHYFERCFTAGGLIEYRARKASRLGHLPTLKVDTQAFITQVGFSFNQEPSHHPHREAEAIRRLQEVFSWMKEHLLSLRNTYIYIFDFPRRPHQKYMVHLVKNLKMVKGQKILTVQGTNRSKRILANMIRHEIRNQEVLLLGGCHCHVWLDPSPPHVEGPLPFNPMADTLTDWLNGYSKDETVEHGDLAYRLTQNYGGPKVGCLFCQPLSRRNPFKCTHGPKNTPARLPVAS